MFRTLHKLFKWLSLKIGLYFFHVIHPRQVAASLSNQRRVHFPDEIEPEYLIPILEYSRVTRPINISLIRVIPDGMSFSDGFACARSVSQEPLTGIKRFPAILSHPKEAPLEHWPNIISILQSHNRFFKQKVKAAQSKVLRRSSSQNQLLDLLTSLWRTSNPELTSGHIWSSMAIKQLQRRSIDPRTSSNGAHAGTPQASELATPAISDRDEFIGGGYSITFYDRKMDVTYFICRLDINPYKHCISY
eukprot:jgi/Hompol1/4823/HPOL_003969-RA